MASRRARPALLDLRYLSGRARLTPSQVSHGRESGTWALRDPGDYSVIDPDADETGRLGPVDGGPPRFRGRRAIDHD
jgi:hypothetical protein